MCSFCVINAIHWADGTTSIHSTDVCLGFVSVRFLACGISNTALGLARGQGACGLTPVSWACSPRGGCGTPCPCDAGPRSSRDVRWGASLRTRRCQGRMDLRLRGGGLVGPLTGPVGGPGQRLPGFNIWTPGCSYLPQDLGSTGFLGGVVRPLWPPVWRGDSVQVPLPFGYSEGGASL